MSELIDLSELNSNIPWVCTDLSENQYGRQLSEKRFEFKDNTRQEVIDLDEYTLLQVEDTINSYGYTLYNSSNGNINIVEGYGNMAKWIIAECLFELEIK